MTSRLRAGLVGLGALLLGGCVIGSLPTSRIRAGDPEQVREVLRESRAVGAGPVNGTGHALVVALVRAPNGTELLAYDLESKQPLWRREADVAARVAIARAVVVHGQSDGLLVGRSLRDGTVRWRQPLPDGWVRVGYAVDGDLVVETLTPAGAPAGESRPGVVVAYDAASGARRWRSELTGPVAAPAARGGLVAVPRQSQYVDLLTARSGTVEAELLSRQEAATFVTALPEGFVFGSKGLFLASASAAGGDRAGKAYLTATLPAFIRSLTPRDMYRPAESAYSAYDRNKVLWRLQPDADGGARFRDDQVVLHHFRFFFGLEAQRGTVLWAYNHPRTDAIASADTGPAIVFVGADGELGALDARTGRRTYTARLAPGERLAVEGATFDADEFAPSEGAAGPSPSAAAALSSIVWDPDRRFADVKLFALDALAALPGPEVSEELLRALDVADEVPQELLDRAMNALVGRRDRAMLDAYVKALSVHPDYAEGKRPKRLDIFAKAVTELRAREAIPALVEHLRLPEVEPDMVRDIADAVLAIGAPEALPAFTDFLLEYRADPALSERPVALEAACDVLANLGGTPEREVLLFVAEEPKTPPGIADYIRGLLAPAGVSRPSAEPTR